MKKVLLVAFHFPPIKASSGLERTLALVRHLPSLGWEPMVLSANARAYESVSEERLSAIPETTVVKRAFTLDAARDLALLGRYPAWLAQPDRWKSWILGAVPSGLAMIKRYRPDVIWTTYPIATSHRIGRVLHQLTGLPWVADFRDPMVEFDSREQRWHPGNEKLRQQRLNIEYAAAHHASGMTFCTESARQICINRYPDAKHSRWEVVPNGFDEEAFPKVTATQSAAAGASGSSRAGPITLLHSGTIYPSPDRDPTHFLKAIAYVRAQRSANARPLKVILRGSGVEHLYSDLLRELGLTDTVVFAPMIDYEAALGEMMTVDGLVLLQGYTSNPAIPAKVYEYFRAGRPLLALTDQDGETAALLRTEQVGIVAPLDDVEAMKLAIFEFVSQIETGTSKVMSFNRTGHFERQRSVALFANIFDRCVQSKDSDVPLKPLGAA